VHIETHTELHHGWDFISVHTKYCCEKTRAEELDTTSKYICQFNTKENITVMCNKDENELYTD
jgi:hypothetical protein